MAMSPDQLVMDLGAIGDTPGLDDEERLKRRFLIYMGVLMSGGGILWGSICATFGLWIPAIVPYGYVVLTLFNLSFFKMTKNWEVARLVQVTISLLLPFLFQWVLGGFIASGAVMLWAMLALVGSLTFSSSRQSIGLMGLYGILTIFSGVIDARVAEQWSHHPSMNVSVAFFVTNIVVITSIVFGLTVYLMVRRESANSALSQANALITELNTNLEEEVAVRTEELRDAVAGRQAILDHLSEGLVAVGPDERVQVANPALADLFASDLLPPGAPIDALPNGLREAVQEANGGREVITRDVPLPGERRAVVSAAPIDRGRGVVALVRDVTLEREIDRMKTDFIATVSHELRTPLTSVLGFAKVTRTRLDDRIAPHMPADDKKAMRAMNQVTGNIDIIIQEGKRLTALINDVLDISKMEAGRMEWRREPIEIQALIKRATDAAAAQFPKNGPVELRIDVADELPQIIGDHDRLLQVLLNLLSNAAKFTDTGHVTVRAQPSDSGVLLEVIDTGDGIEPSMRQAVFEKFKQVGDTLTDKPQGTGLGLPICRQIVHAHGGSIEVDGALGIGSIFRVRLPPTPPQGTHPLA
ncbi:MAG: hypothetical protein EP330_19390 [Deltaproteobacteria bacterium]|nr:MAG: hypothetical protein EP330_19390 [Deltaproteobacteria bacterium]